MVDNYFNCNVQQVVQFWNEKQKLFYKNSHFPCLAQTLK